MALTDDGAIAPLPPNWTGLGYGIALLAAGTGAAWFLGSWLLGVLVWGACLLVLGNQFGGEQRLRITASKLLIENWRPVRGLLIGPTKQRMPWNDVQTASTEDGALKVVSKSGQTLVVCGGLPSEELERLIERIERKAAEEPLIDR